MKIIKCLSELIEEELQDAGKYADLAIKWKEEEPAAAELFHELSKEEMGHMSKLHDMVQELIEAYRQKTGDPPKEMITLYEYLHEKHKETATQVKVKQGMYALQDD